MTYYLFSILEKFLVIRVSKNDLLSLIASIPFNLLTSTNTDKTLNGVAYKRQNCASFANCNALWDGVNKSSKAKNAVKKVCDRQLIRPVITRWNQKYDTVKNLMDCHKKEKLHES